MAASTIQASKVADSIKALMVALNDEIMPSVDELKAQGYITATEYAQAVGKGANTAKRLLDASDKIEKRKAKCKSNIMTMYRVKP